MEDTMKTMKFTLALAAVFAAAIVLAQNTGKMATRDFSIAPGEDVIVAAGVGSGPHIKVFSGNSGAGTLILLRRLAHPYGVRASAPKLSEIVVTKFAGGAESKKTMKLSSIGIPQTIRISFLRPAGPGKVQEYETYILEGVEAKKSKPAKKGGSNDVRPSETISLNFAKATRTTTYIGTANGGVWKTTN
jgi:hypothetical protein